MLDLFGKKNKRTCKKNLKIGLLFRLFRYLIQHLMIGQKRKKYGC